MSDKKPRLFYWEDSEDAWVPANHACQEMISLDMLDDGEIHKIQFKRIDMTDEEFAALPEC